MPYDSQPVLIWAATSCDVHNVLKPSGARAKLNLSALEVFADYYLGRFHLIKRSTDLISMRINIPCYGSVLNPQPLDYKADTMTTELPGLLSYK